MLQPLALTPLPCPTESMTGLILRTAEMNGYESPSIILRYVGMTENEIRSANPPIDKLAMLYGRNPDDFCYMGHASHEKGRRPKQWRILNKEVPALYCNIKSAKVCPECIIEEGYIDGFWDLRYSVACPTHSRMAIKECPACRKSLSWHRQGLLKCRCGQDLSELRGVEVDDGATLDLLELVKRKLHGDPLHTQRLIARGFPLDEIQHMSVATLLGLIGRLQPGNRRKTVFKIPAGMSAEKNAVRLAAGMLSNWPIGLYDHLEATYRDTTDITGSTLHKQFQRFYSSFFKSGLPMDEVGFIQEAFMRFGNQRWKTNAFIDTRFARKLNIQSDIVGIYGVAEYLGIHVAQAQRYVEQGLIECKNVETVKMSRKLFDVTTLPFKKAEGRSHKLRDAAKFLGIPVSLLSMLRNEGAYKMQRLAKGLNGYSEYDLINFREILVTKVAVIKNCDSEEHITLGSVMRIKLRDQKFTASIIKSILNGQIIPEGRIGDEISDIVLMRASIMTMVSLYQQNCRLN
jgi:hypothetical protein